jgi:hypothetical protein
MTMKADPIVTARAVLADAVIALNKAVDPTERARALDTAMSVFGKGERGEWAPPSERDRARREHIEQAQARAGEKLLALHEAISEQEEILAAVLVDVQQPPTPLQHFRQTHQDKPYTTADELAVESLHEQRLARIARELDGASPAAVLVAYERGLQAEDFSVVGYIENHGSWAASNATSSNTGSARSGMQLARKMREVRAARIAPELHEWQADLKKARTSFQRAVDLHAVVMRKPQLAAAK